MRFYPVPFQLESEERVIGGALTLRQFVYLVAGAALGGGAALALPLPLAFRLFFFFILAGAGGALAFARPGGEGLDAWLVRWAAWRFGRRQYWWEGSNGE